MANKEMKKPEKGGKPKKIVNKRAGESSEQRLKRDMALARQTTDRANP